MMQHKPMFSYQGIYIYIMLVLYYLCFLYAQHPSVCEIMSKLYNNSDFFSWIVHRRVKVAAGVLFDSWILHQAQICSRYAHFAGFSNSSVLWLKFSM